MLTAIAPRVCSPMSSAAAATPPRTQDAPPAPPTPPTNDTLDINVIDTAREAAQLPILEPSFQLGLAGGLAFAIMSGMQGGHSVPLVSIDVNNQFAGNDVTANFTFDLKNQKNPLSVTGFANANPIQGQASLDQTKQTVSWNGKIGDNPETLTFGVDQKAQALLIGGKFGSVDADLRLNVIGDPTHFKGPQDFQGYTLSGTLGGEQYTVENRIEFNQNGTPDAHGKIDLGTMTSKGSLGGKEIDKTYSVSARQTAAGIVATADGAGLNAGIQQKVSTVVTLVP